MKTALIITGNIRNFENNYQVFDALISKFDCDVFICVSDLQYELHPHVQKVNNFYLENCLTIEMVKSKLSVCKNMMTKIKYINLFDNNSLNSDIFKIDVKKKYVGMDIYKQYTKIQTCVDFIENYEINNNIKYDYVIKTRFDININMDSLPQSFVANCDFYSNNSAENSIDAIILISSSVSKLKILTNEIILNFYNNNAPEMNVYDSIHSLLNYAMHKHKFNVIKSLQSFINRNYENMFNTNVTLVTCFYNINREHWSTSARPVEKYFENAKNVLNKLNPMVIFTTNEYVERCLEIRKETDTHLIYTTVIILDFDQLNYFDKLNQIKEIQTKNLKNIIPISSAACPEFCVPEYIILINNKTNFLKKTALQNLYNSQIFQWVDFGIHSNIYDFKKALFDKNYFNTIFYRKNKIRLAGFLKPKNILNKIEYYNTNASTTAGGLIGGNRESIIKLYDLCEKEFSFLIENNIMNQEQYIYYILLSTNPDLFDYSILDGWNQLCETYSKNNTNIAICMSGNTRTFDQCENNIKTHIIDPLIRSGCNVNTFFSTWTDEDLIKNKSKLENLCDKIVCQNYNQNYFLNYHTKQYLKFPGLCGDGTSANASSMFYNIKNSFGLSENYSNEHNIKYDIIIRLRPDIIYQNSININSIMKALLNDYLYMPQFHGKYSNVTLGMMDHFYYGNASVMTPIMKTFDNITNYLKDDSVVHTAEGFLHKSITSNNIFIYNFNFTYGVIRQHNKYESIYV